MKFGWKSYVLQSSFFEGAIYRTRESQQVLSLDNFRGEETEKERKREGGGGVRGRERKQELWD